MVLLKGRYAGSRSGGFYLEKEGEKIIISIQPSTNIKKPALERDDLIQVIGIASQYNDNYRLLPRFQDDIQILEKARQEEETTLFLAEKEEEPLLISIKEARRKQKGQEVLIEGFVTALPGTFSSHYFYLQDKTGGIQVYCTQKNWPLFVLGQKLRVLGEISQVYQEKRIKISQPEDIGLLEENSRPSPLIYHTGQINEEAEGRLIKTKGKVAELKGLVFYLDDGTGRIKIYLKKETKIKKPRLKEGKELEITGIVSQYKEAYRLLPRQNEDIVVLKGKAEEEENEKEQALTEKGEQKVLGTTAQRTNNRFWVYLLSVGGFASRSVRL